MKERWKERSKGQTKEGNKRRKKREESKGEKGRKEEQEKPNGLAQSGLKNNW